MSVKGGWIIFRTSIQTPSLLVSIPIINSQGDFANAPEQKTTSDSPRRFTLSQDGLDKGGYQARIGSTRIQI